MYGLISVTSRRAAWSRERHCSCFPDMQLLFCHLSDMMLYMKYMSIGMCLKIWFYPLESMAISIFDNKFSKGLIILSIIISFVRLKTICLTPKHLKNYYLHSFGIQMMWRWRSFVSVHFVNVFHNHWFQRPYYIVYYNQFCKTENYLSDSLPPEKLRLA